MVLAFGIDTTSLKGGVISREGEVLARAEAKLKPLRHESDATAWLPALAVVTAQLEPRRWPMPSPGWTAGRSRSRRRSPPPAAPSSG